MAYNDIEIRNKQKTNKKSNGGQMKSYTVNGETFILDEAREYKIEKAARRFATRHGYGIARESTWWTWVEHWSQATPKEAKAWKKVLARATK